MQSWLAGLSSALQQDQEYLDCRSLFSLRDRPYTVLGARGAFLPLFLALQGADHPVVLVVPTQADGQAMKNDLECFGCQDVLLLPSIQQNIYDPSPVNHGFVHHVFALQTAKICIIPLRALVKKLPPLDYFTRLAITINTGQKLDIPDLCDQLTSRGYLRTPRVSIPGEFAVRGEVLDIFLHTETLAHRIQFEFDTVCEIRLFHAENQIASAVAPRVLIPPAREAVLHESDYDIIVQNWQKKHPRTPLSVQNLQENIHYHELFLPYLFDEAQHILQYFPPNYQLIFTEHERILQQAQSFAHELSQLYRQGVRQEHVIPPPEELFFALEAIGSPTSAMFFAAMSAQQPCDLTLSIEGPRSFFGNINLLKDELTLLLKNNYRIFIFAETEQQALRISQLFSDMDITVIPRGLSCGFCVPVAKLLFLCEHEIFGRKKRAAGAQNKLVDSQAIDSFVDLSPEDYVVHVNYGISQFKGIERLRTGGQERDYIVLEFSDKDIIYVPIEQVNLVQRYIGNEGSAPRLDKIGSKSWNAKKTQAKKNAEDLAEFLLALYAKREASQGFAYPPDDQFQLEFEANFPYQETPDQLLAMEEIKKDMESIRPMDRLVCGDVGYGKTELAMRAAFKSVMAGKQVVMLCPTTILAEQHYKSFLQRFERFSFIRIALLSRMVEKKAQREILEKLERGEVDLLIGTHRMLSKDIIFRDLGLMIIDEEQRFGVKDKERIKNMKANIDTLMLSATPIPRTLHMSLVRIRDLSTLKTPPAKRQPIETFVEEFEAERIKNAILTEIKRHGQIFYLHNRVETLEQTKLFIQALVPEVLVEIAHGQMAAHELDDVMYRFIHHGFHVLVSTTIIESGIDIPNVNTIVIDRADMYGISQLYQLRGRVGRSDRVAYAYLFYPDRAALSELAMKRLEIINDFTNLGDGFKIAMKDMEVRGTGNLLGRDQSGHIEAIGFDMYLRLLNEAIEEKTSKEKTFHFETFLELDYSGFIPDDYISDVVEKMEIYKKISSVMKEDDVENLYQEIADRFGPLPDEVVSLLGLAEVRCLCRRLKIRSIRERGGTAQIEFARLAELSMENLIRLIQESGGLIRPDKNNQTAILVETGKIGLKEKSEFLRDHLARLA